MIFVKILNEVEDELRIPAGFACVLPALFTPLGGPSTVYCVYLAVQWNPVNTVTNGPKKLAVLKRVFFYTKMYGGFCQTAKKVAVIMR